VHWLLLAMACSSVWLLVLGVIASMDCKDAAYCCRCSVVCLLDTTVSLTKTDEPIEMPFGLSTRMGPGNHVLGGGMDRPVGRGNSGVVSPLDCVISKHCSSMGLQTCPQGIARYSVTSEWTHPLQG